MRTMCSREIFSKKCRQQQIIDSVLKGAWHYNHVTFTPIAKNFMLYCRLIYMLSVLCVRLTIKVKVGIPESFKVGWYPPKKLGRVTLKRVTKKFLEVSRCSRAKQRQRNVPKKCAARAKLFLLIRPIVVFHRFSDVACLPRLALHDFIFCLNKL